MDEDTDLYGAPKGPQSDQGPDPESEDDDDDVEVVISTTAPDTFSTAKSQISQQFTKTNTIAKADPDLDTTISQKATIDINIVGQIGGKDLFDINLDGFQDKQWRKPGADITDYFNFGFNEVTWKAYCTKQKMVRSNQPGFFDGDAMGMMGMPPPHPMAMGMQQPMMPPPMPMGPYPNMPLGQYGMRPPMFDPRQRGKRARIGDNDDDVIDLTKGFRK